MHSALALMQFEHGYLRSHFTFLLRQRMHEGCFAVADPEVVVGLLFESVILTGLLCVCVCVCVRERERERESWYSGLH